MRFGSYSFDRVEFAGSLGDLGTLVPLSVALIAINGLNATAVFLMVGLFYIVAGAYYKLPIPVQPLKVVAAIAIASKLDAATIAASGYLMGIVLIFIGVTGIVDTLARFFTKPIVRGIQLGLGLILINKAVAFIEKDELFINGTPSYLGAVSVNTLVGVIGALIVLVLLTSRRLPAAIAVLVFGLAVGILTGALSGVNFSPGYEPLHLMMPNSAILLNALVLLVIPQIPLTIGNAVMGTCDAANTLFGRTKASKSTVRALSMSMGLANIGAGAVGGMPMCHGAGGLAAHYRFGARTGGANIMIGTIFLAIALLVGKISISLLSLIPNSILGVLLLFAGMELAMLVKDIGSRKDFFIVFLIAGIGLATTNMGLAFIVGMVVQYILNAAKIRI